jgi:hypothetical protein
VYILPDFEVKLGWDRVKRECACEAGFRAEGKVFLPYLNSALRKLLLKVCLRVSEVLVEVRKVSRQGSNTRRYFSPFSYVTQSLQTHIT